MAFGLGVAKGMLTTISHLVKPPVTIQYPEERLDMPIWTRGRPRLIYEIDTGELRCTACGACALACPVDVIKIEQHPSPTGKGKVLDRFDIDMAGYIECALCVEACPFRAITMAPDFEMASTYDRAADLVFVWVRGTLPRFRYDQLMQFAWKRMLPVSLALVSLSALFASLSSLLGPIVRLAPGIR